MSEIERPYPWFTWQVTINASATFHAIANNTDEALTIAAGSYWGLATDTGGDPTTDSLTYKLAQALLTHTQISGAVGSYVWTGAGQPLHRFALTKLGNNAADEVQFGTPTNFDPGSFGFSTGDKAINTGTTLNLAGEWNADGYWSPYVPSAFATRDAETMVGWEGTSSPFDRASTTHTILNDDADNQIRVFTFDLVHRAFVEPRYAQASIFAANANRAAADPNNLLSKFLRAAASGAEIRYYWTAETYDVVRLVDTSITSVGKLARQSGTSKRFYTVVVPMSFESQVIA